MPGEFIQPGQDQIMRMFLPQIEDFVEQPLVQEDFDAIRKLRGEMGYSLPWTAATLVLRDALYLDNRSQHFFTHPSLKLRGWYGFGAGWVQVASRTLRGENVMEEVIKQAPAREAVLAADFAQIQQSGELLKEDQTGFKLVDAMKVVIDERLKERRAEFSDLTLKLIDLGNKSYKRIFEEINTGNL